MEYLISRTCWHRDIDAGKFGSPLERLRHPKLLQPTLEHTNSPVDQRRAEKWIEQFASVNVPVVMAGEMGLDGTTYEFSLGDKFGGLTVTWWVRAPTAWREFEDKFNLIRGEIEELFQNA